MKSEKEHKYLAYMLYGVMIRGAIDNIGDTMFGEATLVIKLILVTSAWGFFLYGWLKL